MKPITISMLILAACSGDAVTHDAPVPDASVPDAAAPDAPAPDAAAPDAPALDCLGQPSPTTAPDPLPVLGKVFAVVDYKIAPAVGATVVVHGRADDGILGQATTGADGAYAIQVASGGVPVEAYFTVEAAGKLPTRADPGAPLVGGESELLLVADDAEIGRWYAAAGAAHTAGAGVLITAAVDCQNRALAGTTLAAAPEAATITYYDVVAQRWDPALATSTNGYALVTGATMTVHVTASMGATTLPTRTVVAPPGTFTIAVLRPRL